MAEPSKHTSRLFLLDRKSGQKFLIDSGSEICVIPPSPTMNKAPQSNFSLFAANNTKIPAYGMVRKELNLGLRRPFIWTLIIADVSSPIIGADFLKHFNLLIDLKKKRLVDLETSLFTSCVFSNIVQPSILTYAFRQKSDKCSPRQIRQLDFISQFTTNIVHIPGSDNIAADVLSRVSAITFPSQIDYDCIAETQQTDQELHTLIASGTSLELKR
ncbi:gag-Pol polyprotein [Trichonephila clavipes]|nr:gag-Pol polyprotein [Trichonephila clavipes]